MMRPEDILSPCEGPLELADCRVRNGDRVLGTWIAEQRRIQWDWPAMGVEPALAERGLGEARVFDRWATERFADLARVTPAGRSGAGYGLDAWLRECPALRAAEAASGIRIALSGKRILDVGGSAQNLVYWLPERPLRVDSVDVSPLTQMLGHARLRRAHGDYEAAYGTPVVFHTIPAERLPFADGAFDLVFSWSSLHHCARPRVFHEILRVLAPGGVLAVLDRYLSGPLYLAMRARRRLLSMDCGTDDPVRRSEWRALAQMMEHSWWAPFGSRVLLAYLRQKLLRRPGGSLPAYRGAAAMPSASAFGRALDAWFGRDVVFLGRKPTAP
jgi:SAM-dependent methyltransferase